MRWPIANRTLLTLRSPQFCPLKSVHCLPFRRDYGHPKRLNATTLFSTSPNHGRADPNSPGRGRRARKPLLASTVAAGDHHVGGSQRDRGSSLQKDQENVFDNLGESELAFSLANLWRTVGLPTKQDMDWIPAGYFRIPWKPAELAVKALRGTSSMELTEPMLSASGKRFFRYHFTINLPNNKNAVAAGDGYLPKQAKLAAGLHALAKLRDMGLLTDTGPRIDEDEKEGMLDVYNYAALYRCVPSVSIEQRDGLSSITIGMPEHGIDVATTSIGSIINAEIAAAREFKRQAEVYHLRKGTDTVVVSDRHALNIDNAPDFFTFYRDMQEPFGEFHVAFQRLGAMWAGQLSFDLLDLGPQAEIRASDWAQVLKIANLVGALSVLKKSQNLCDEFNKALVAGNGKYLPKISPRVVALNHEVLQELKAAQGLEWPSRTVQDRSPADQSSNELFREPRPRHALTPDELALKSSRLREKLGRYKTRGNLGCLRQAPFELPMNQYASRVRQIVHDNIYCVIIGATGSGKTTQVPQILLEQAIESGMGAACNVICTQPRRMAATSVAQRVASERGEQLQDTVGYHVRFDPKLPKPGGSILYCTTGILLQQLQHAPDDVLDHASHLVIDEVHERDLINDFLFITLKHTIAARAAQGKKLPRVVLMSATIDSEQFAAYFKNSLLPEMSNDCPTLNVPGRAFPVREYHLDDILQAMKDRHGEQELRLLRTDMDTIEYLRAEEFAMDDTIVNADASPESVIEWKSHSASPGVEDVFHADNKGDALVPLGLAATVVAHITKTSENGAILVFLPGMKEIEDMDRILRTHAPLGVDFNNTEQFQIIMLHSSIQDSQKTVFDPVPTGCRKIILSTNIAETSVTIPDVQFVIDTGKSREKHYDQTRRITQLQCTWISKSNAKQRAGRAGRVQDGVYYALFTRSRHESMRAVGLPEILRSDLQETCLDVKTQTFKMPVADFLAGAIEPPSPSAVDIALRNLISLGALTEEEELTPLGRVLASLPVHPTLGKMIVLGVVFRCLDPMITLGAAAQQYPLFMAPPDQLSAVDKIKQKFAGSSGSDHMMLLKAFGAARSASVRGGRGASKMFRSNFISYMAFKNIDLTAHEIVDVLIQAGLIRSQETETTLQYGGHEMNHNSGSEALIKALLVAGLYPNFALQTRRAVFRTSAEKTTRMHRSSVNAGLKASATFFTYNSLSLSSDGKTTFLRETSSVTPLMALLFGGPLAQRGRILEMDQWLPMEIKAKAPKRGSSPVPADESEPAAPGQILFLRGLLDRMLADTFEDLASQAPLAEDRMSMRDELVSTLARILGREAGDRGDLSPRDSASGLARILDQGVGGQEDLRPHEPTSEVGSEGEADDRGNLSPRDPTPAAGPEGELHPGGKARKSRNSSGTGAATKSPFGFKIPPRSLYLEATLEVEAGDQGNLHTRDPTPEAGPGGELRPGGKPRESRNSSGNDAATKSPFGFRIPPRSLSPEAALEVEAGDQGNLHTRDPSPEARPEGELCPGSKAREPGNSSSTGAATNKTKSPFGFKIPPRSL